MSGLLKLYEILIFAGKPLLERTLIRRLNQGKEDKARLPERKGVASLPRPSGKLVWIHAASVGESQSTLILIDAIGKAYPHVKIMVTTGTMSSANLMAQRLPSNAFHQFIPLDHPLWVKSFLDHWTPDIAFWMESELWPNMVMDIGRRKIPLALINARLSDKSFRHWKTAKGMIRTMLSCFTVILTQTKADEDNFRALGAVNVATTGNLKYSSTPLPYDQATLTQLQTVIGDRPCWVYASTHEGEEKLACAIHQKLSGHIDGLLTIIVPRHIGRRDRITEICDETGLKYVLRGESRALPSQTDDIYIADTLGELGLFYRLAPIAVIGRSFSDDGGGGHNPVEAAQLGCAVVTGPNVQFQQQMFDDMLRDESAIQAKTEEQLYTVLSNLLNDAERCKALQGRAAAFALEKSHVIDDVMAHLSPILKTLEETHAA